MIRVNGLILQQNFMPIKSNHILMKEQLPSVSTYETELVSGCTLSIASVFFS